MESRHGDGAFTMERDDRARKNPALLHTKHSFFRFGPLLRHVATLELRKGCFNEDDKSSVVAFT